MNSRSKLPETFSRVRPSIIAFASAWAVVADGEKPPLLPNIIGTGFIVDERGIAVTNRHVIEALEKLPKVPGRVTTFAMIFTEIKVEGNTRTIQAACVRLRRRFMATEIEINTPFYGEITTDLGIVQLGVRDVPAMRISEQESCIRAGMPVATAGFPLGSEALLVYGNINQLTPTLRHGIVSGVFPFDVPHAHGFTIDIMSQGGASGSPVFDPETGDVLGILHAGFIGTNFTHVVPGWLIALSVRQLLQEKQWEFADIPTLAEYGGGRTASGIGWDWIAPIPQGYE